MRLPADPATHAAALVGDCASGSPRASTGAAWPRSSVGPIRNSLVSLSSPYVPLIILLSSPYNLNPDFLARVANMPPHLLFRPVNYQDFFLRERRYGAWFG